MTIDVKLTPAQKAPLDRGWIRTAAHWGVYDVHADTLAVKPLSLDPNPSAIGRGLGEAVDHPLRIRQPMIRRGWLEGAGFRGADEYLAVGWDFALDKAAGAIDRIRATHGNEAIFGGSYGWGSAGRFHHPQSQVHRFLNTAGGYVRSVNSYSAGALEVILPHVLCTVRELEDNTQSWKMIAEHGELVVGFGGIASKNSQVNPGGVTRHTAAGDMRMCRARGVEFINISPMRTDIDEELGARWLPIRPGSDTAMMLALAHVLISEDRHDRDFVARCCVGFPAYADYVLGRSDGIPKDPQWASALTGIPADGIFNLAREIAARRSIVTVSWSLQRQEFGEHVYWAAVALAALSGSVGKPGGGFCAGYGAVHSAGSPRASVPAAALEQKKNPVAAFIPVARICDMLLNPGGSFAYNGGTHVYPDIKLIYWCGGNPFHHHQDLGRLSKAWQRPDTVIVHEPWWNALARRADIVFPSAVPLERNDIASGARDGVMVAMKQVRAPVNEARTDYEIFSALAGRLGCGQDFTEGRDEMGWIAALYELTRQNVAEAGGQFPDFETFWSQGMAVHAIPPRQPDLFERFRRDPDACPLSTPSGRIELWSATIAGFGLPDCPPHPSWMSPVEWLGSERARLYPVHLISNQPLTRLHSQYDHVGVSAASKVQGREPVTIHPADAAARGIAEGDLVRIFNDRGACLAGAVLSDTILPGVIQLATGAWYDPAEPQVSDHVCLHGNPNVLTRDVGTSSLAQASSAQSCLVDLERWKGDPPPLRITELPRIVEFPDEADRLSHGDWHDA